MRALWGFEGPAKGHKFKAVPYFTLSKELFKFEGPYKSGRYLLLGSSSYVKVPLKFLRGNFCGIGASKYKRPNLKKFCFWGYKVLSEMITSIFTPTISQDLGPLGLELHSCLIVSPRFRIHIHFFKEKWFGWVRLP